MSFSSEKYKSICEVYGFSKSIPLKEDLTISTSLKELSSHQIFKNRNIISLN